MTRQYFLYGVAEQESLTRNSSSAPASCPTSREGLDAVAARVDDGVVGHSGSLQGLDKLLGGGFEVVILAKPTAVSSIEVSDDVE